MRPSFILLLALLAMAALAGCVPPPQNQGYYEDGRYGYDDGYQQGYDQGYRQGYRQNGPATYYQNNQQQIYEQRRRRAEANCNNQWVTCSNVCNTIHNANSRAVCVANCNNALNQCKRGL